MIDCLTALFRLNSRNVIWSLYPICLDSESPPIFKLVLVKSCLQIASEESRLPWNPTISATYSNLAGPLRKLFQEYLSKSKERVKHLFLFLFLYYYLITFFFQKKKRL